MDPDSVVPPDGPELMRRRNGWWCGWRRRIPPGAMIASWVPWPILASGYRTRRWVISCADTESLLPLWSRNSSVKEGGVSGSGLLCRTSLLDFLFTRPAFNRGRGCRFFEVFCGYGDQVPTCKITMRNKHAFSYCTYNWLHDFLVGFALLRGHP